MPGILCSMTAGGISRGLLGFWALWFGVVVLTNTADAAVAAGVLPADWRFASGNYALIREVTSRYGTPGWLLPPMFAGVIAWEALASALFARAWIIWGRDAGRGRDAARVAYAAGIGLWCAFLMADEIFVAFQVSATHVRLLIAHLACVILLSLSDPR